MDDLSLEDRLAIHEIIASYPHIIDNPNTVDGLHLVYSDDVVLEAAALGRLTGLDAVKRMYAERPEEPRVDHLGQDTVITSVREGRVYTRTHFVAVWQDGTASSGDYLDVMERTGAGWRIVARRVVNRLPPPEIPEADSVYSGWELW